MRVVLLLSILAAIGVALAQWLSNRPTAPAAPRDPPNGTAAPAAPTRPQDVKAFEQDINRFMRDAAERRARQEPQQ